MLEDYEIKITECERENPRTEFNQTAKMFCFHRKYDLGDKHDLKPSQFSGWKEMEEFLAKDAFVILPLYLYDHSGLTISTSPFSCSWDSGQIGFVVVRAKDVKPFRLHGEKVADFELRMRKLIEAEVEEYDIYLRHVPIYQYQIFDKDGEEFHVSYGFDSEVDALEHAQFTIRNF